MEGSNLMPQSGKLVLMIWHCKVDTIDLEEDNLKLPVDLPHDARELMRPYAKLCEVFRVINNNPPEGIHLHIFVQRPYSKRN
jgi:hypothetical protein